MRHFLLSSLMLLSCSGTVLAHKSHTSVAEVEWNARSQRFEVAMRLHIADLEDAISVRQNKRFRLEGNKTAAKELSAYVADNFAIQTQAAEKCQLHWVGMELELHEAWVYFEIEMHSAKPDALSKTDQNTVKHWDQLFEQPKSDKSSLTNSAATTRATFAPKEVKIKSTMLFGVQPEQKNVVSVTVQGSTDSVVLLPERPEEVLNVVSKSKWQLGRNKQG